ncbi:LOW QUALITY PROTEIN: hypothetical protein ACHAWX_005950 [Stephanocyclus meneghinianus]
MSELASSPHKHVKHDRKDLAFYASAKFESGMHLVHESKFEMARKRFQSAKKASILLHNDTYHMSIALSYDIIGYLDMALEELDEAKLHLSAALEICEKKMDLLVDKAGENNNMRDLLMATIQRIVSGLGLLEIRRSEGIENSAMSFDASFIDSISDDYVKYINLSSVMLTSCDTSFNGSQDVSEKHQQTVGAHAQGFRGNKKNPPCCDRSSDNNDSCGIESTTIDLLDNCHGSAESDAPTWLMLDESPPATMCSLVRKKGREDMAKSFDATISNRISEDLQRYNRPENTLVQFTLCTTNFGSTSATVSPSCLDESPPPVPFTSLSEQKAGTEPRIEIVTVSGHRSLNVEQLYANHHLSTKNNDVDHVTPPLPKTTMRLVREIIPENCPADDEDYGEIGGAMVGHQGNQEDNDFNPPSLLISAIVHRASENIGLGDEEIFIPEAVAVNPDICDNDIPCASIVLPAKNSLTLTVRGWKVPACVLGSMCIIIAALFVILAFYSSLRGFGDTSVPHPQIQSDIERRVLQRNVTFSGMNHTDPRFLALDWIMNKDEMQLKLLDFNLHQRYILALVAFQFGSLEWTSCGNYTRNETCFASDLNDTEHIEESFVWLSGTDECGWYGLTCDGKGKVIGMELGGNNLVGEIPPEIGGLQYLKRLVLDDNCIYGTLPPELGKMTSLQELNLTLNTLSGYLPDDFYNLSSLVRLDLSLQNRRFNETRHCKLNNDTTRKHYNDKNLGLQGVIFEDIWRLHDLKEIVLNANSFSGSMVAEIEPLVQLEELNAGSNGFYGSIPLQLSKLSTLRSLQLEHNLLSGSMPENIGEATDLDVISVHANELTGMLPDSLYTLKNLKELDLHSNVFEGTTNSEIGNLRNLTYCIVSNNKFTGTVPSELGLCQKLEMVHIDNTLIEGIVPEEVCSLTLKHVYSEDQYAAEFLRADCLPPNAHVAVIPSTSAWVGMCDTVTVILLANVANPYYINVWDEELKNS